MRAAWRARARGQRARGAQVLADERARSDAGAAANPARWISNWTSLLSTVSADPAAAPRVHVELLDSPDAYGLQCAHPHHRAARGGPAVKRGHASRPHVCMLHWKPDLLPGDGAVRQPPHPTVCAQERGAVARCVASQRLAAHAPSAAAQVGSGRWAAGRALAVPVAHGRADGRQRRLAHLHPGSRPRRALHARGMDCAVRLLGCSRIKRQRLCADTLYLQLSGTGRLGRTL